MLMQFLILLYGVMTLNCIKLTARSKQAFTDPASKQLQCAICLQMFTVNFDYEQITKNLQYSHNIKKYLAKIGKDESEIDKLMNKDKFNNLAQDVAMQYFFKGADSQFEEKINKNFNSCKLRPPMEDQPCDKLRLGLCEDLLSYDREICINSFSGSSTYNLIKTNNAHDLNNSNSFNNLNIQSLNEIPEIGSSLKPIRKQMENNNNLNNMNNNNNNLFNFPSTSSLLKFKQQEQEQESEINGLAKLQNILKNNNNNNNQYNSLRHQMNEDKPADISLLELSPSYIKKNYSSIPKTHWQPPKPVLLENFDRNIGSQLQEISILVA
jgi:hypothetical protein